MICSFIFHFICSICDLIHLFDFFIHSSPLFSNFKSFHLLIYLFIWCWNTSTYIPLKFQYYQFSKSTMFINQNNFILNTYTKVFNNVIVILFTVHLCISNVFDSCIITCYYQKMSMLFEIYFWKYDSKSKKIVKTFY